LAGATALQTSSVLQEGACGEMSASNSDPEMEEKRSIYCSDARCLAFWVVNPEAKAVSVFTKSAPPQLFLGHSLDLPVEIGGSISVKGIFD
jgi:Uma2 family endonuclease